MNWVTLLYVYLLCLLPYALGQSSVWSGESNVASYRIGSHVLACDVNNDNHYDIVSTGVNGVYVWLGGPFGSINSTADYMIDIIVPAITVDGLGLECADINMDGYADVLVGNWTAANPNIRIYNGSATGLNTVPTGFGISSANYYGAELAAADYNNDGKMDLAVGAYGAARVYFHYGLGTSGLNPSYSAPNELLWPAPTYAQNLNPCDLSNDGYPDLLIGCRSCNSQYGVLFLASNVGGVWTHAQIWNGTVAGGFFGFDAKCGDFNGDGNKDIAIISQGASTMEIHYGTGDIATIAREPNVTLTLGASCRSISVADLNADGYDDIVGGFNAINQAKLFMGGPTLVTGSSASYSYQGPAGGSGWKVAALPNLDGLGNKDVAFGTFVFSNGQASEGSVTVLYNLGSSIAPSVSPSRTPSPSVTPSATPSNTPTPSVTPSPSMSPSVTPTQTPSSSPTNSPTASATPTASRTPSPSISPSHSITPSITPSNSVSSSPQSDSSANKGLDPTIVISVAIGVPIISCTFFGSVLAILLIRRRKNKQANTELPMADVKEPSRPSSPGSSASPIDMFTRSGSFSGSAPNIVIPVVTKKSNSLEEDNSNYASMPSGIDDNTSGSRSTGTGARSASGRTASKRNILPKEQDWEIPYSELKSLTKIGSGAFGEVYRGRWKGVDVAVKKILHSAEPDDKSDIKLQDFFAEAELMRKLKPHPNITQLLGVVIHPLCIVTEFIANGSLYSYLQSKKEMSDEMKLTIIKGTAAGMLHLHSQGVVHRDLAARNILLDGTLRPKVCDFGMSRVVIDNRSNSTENAVGPIKWMSPESLTSRLYSTKSDVWSFGVVIFEILTRENPYHGYNLMQIGTKVAMGTLSLVTELENTGVKYPDNVVEVFKMCLEFKAQNRPEFEDIVNMLD